MNKVKVFKVLSENPAKSEVLIEFPEAQWEKLYAALREADIVDLIDSTIPDSK